MKVSKTDTLVLSTRHLGEADRLVTLLTWEKGKISAVAKGARKTRSKLASGVDLFVYSYMSLYRGRSLYTVTQVEIKERFQNLHTEPLLYSYASYLAELMERFMEEDEENRDMCNLLLSGWRSLNRGADVQLLARSFELKLMLLGGYAPRLKECVACQKPGAAGSFSIKMGGALCDKCSSKDGRTLVVLPGTLSLAAHLMSSPFRELDRVKASPRQREELKRITLSFLGYYLELDRCRSLQYLLRWEKNHSVPPEGS